MRGTMLSSFALSAKSTRSFIKVSKRTEPRIRTVIPGFNEDNTFVYSSCSRKKAFTLIPSAMSDTSKNSKLVSLSSRPSTASMTPTMTTFFISFRISSMDVTSPVTPLPKRQSGAVSFRCPRFFLRPRSPLASSLLSVFVATDPISALLAMAV